MTSTALLCFCNRRQLLNQKRNFKKQHRWSSVSTSTSNMVCLHMPSSTKGRVAATISAEAVAHADSMQGHPSDDELYLFRSQSVPFTIQYPWECGDRHKFGAPYNDPCLSLPSINIHPSLELREFRVLWYYSYSDGAIFDLIPQVRIDHAESPTQYSL